jgi:hypothetical protein
MTSPASGLAYFLWLRIRWAAAGTVAYLVCLAFAAHIVPEFGEPDPIVLALCLLTASIAHLLHVFTLGPADLGVKNSGFPTHMFVLPLKTQTLSGWPILYAAATFAILWVLIVHVVLRPAGYSPPVLWPAAISATAIGWIQSISWSPFPTPFARVPAIVVAVVPLIAWGTWATIYPDSSFVLFAVVALCALWLGVAYGVAIRGIARARCGTESYLTILPKRLRAAVKQFLIAHPFHWSAFSSPSVAQLWHECRRNIIWSPAMTAFIGLPLLVFSCSVLVNPDSNHTLLFGGLQLSPTAMLLLIWITIPLLLATTAGQGLGKLDMWGKDAMPGFYAIRPMTTARFVAVKLLAAAVSAIFGWIVIWLLIGIWALVEISPLNAHESLVRAAWDNVTLRRTPIAVSAAIAVVALTWRLCVIGMWPSLSGRKVVSNTLSIAALGWMLLAVIAGSWLYRHPEVQPRLLVCVPYLLGVLLTAKFSATACVVCRLHQLRLITPRTTTKLLAAWSTTTIAIFGGLSQLVLPNWFMAGCVALAVPLARLAIAPLALHWNRHR